ncbi:phosphotriesterase [Marvinbryantia formatexigens]|nr:phosphotriesterase [Marvinbryantia formatexigens]UWO23658.1 phosphotriesterase [Marvinbryantia formatexigens DSM 14469]SDF64871.1 phosphotriesterase-related protein [Marvinbryantia formatexigens]
MSTIKTVCKEIRPEELGFTSMHEHLLCDFTEMMKLSIEPEIRARIDYIPESMLKLNLGNLYALRTGMGTFSKDCASLYDMDYMVGELKAFAAMGGKAIVDASPIAAKAQKNVRGLQELSEKSGVHVVTCTGLYTAATQPEEYKAMPEEELVAFFKKQMEEGLDGTGVKPGFMKCAINTPGDCMGVDASEIKAVRACARVAAETGCSIHIHNGYPMGMEECVPVAQMVLDLGVKPDKLLMLHMDSLILRPHTDMEYISDFAAVKTVNIDLMLRLLDMGVNVGFDSWDMLVGGFPTNTDRLKALAELLRRGYGNKIVMGHDAYDKSRSVAYGYTGFTGFIRNALPVLRQLGYEKEIGMLTTENPARILAF